MLQSLPVVSLTGDDAVGGAGSSDSEKEDAPLQQPPSSLIQLSKEEVAVLDASASKSRPNPPAPPTVLLPAPNPVAPPTLPMAMMTRPAAGFVGIQQRPPNAMFIQRPGAPPIPPSGALPPPPGVGALPRGINPAGIIRAGVPRMVIGGGGPRPIMLGPNPAAALPVLPLSVMDAAPKAAASASASSLEAELLLPPPPPPPPPPPQPESIKEEVKDLKDLIRMDSGRTASPIKDELTDILSDHINLDTMVTESGLPNMDCKVTSLKSKLNQFS